jgi:type IV pilus assembly protein PilX
MRERKGIADGYGGARGFHRARAQGGTGACPGRQRGAVLIVGQVVLLMLTWLGVVATRSSVAQQRMALNWHELHLAFEAAEAALRHGERQGPLDGVSAPSELGDPAGWDGVAGHAGRLPDFHPGVAEAPSYHVGPPQGVRVGVELPPRWRRVHTVTGRGTGRHPASVVVVQSVYEPSDE